MNLTIGEQKTLNLSAIEFNDNDRGNKIMNEEREGLWNNGSVKVVVRKRNKKWDQKYDGSFRKSLKRP